MGGHFHARRVKLRFKDVVGEKGAVRPLLCARATYVQLYAVLALLWGAFTAPD